MIGERIEGVFEVASLDANRWSWIGVRTSKGEYRVFPAAIEPCASCLASRELRVPCVGRTVVEIRADFDDDPLFATTALLLDDASALIAFFEYGLGPEGPELLGPAARVDTAKELREWWDDSEMSLVDLGAVD
jgi:hypothetical protein